MHDRLPARLPASPELEQRLIEELRPGEQLLWSTQPQPTAFRWSYPGLFVFGIIWNVIIWFLVIAFVMSRQPEIVQQRFWIGMFWIPFVLVGLLTLLSPVWLGRRAKRMVYAVTDSRTLIISASIIGRGWVVETFAPDRLTSMTCRQRSDGSGDVIFAEYTTGRSTDVAIIRRGFLGVPDAVAVEWLILSTLLPDQVRTI